MSTKIEFRTSSVLHIPLESYPKDFTFIINDEEFHTSSFIADLLSPKISRLHRIDPTLSEYSIFTKSRGDFKKVLAHLTFECLEVKDDEISFYSEIFEALEISTNEINVANEPAEQYSTSFIDKLEKHHQFPLFFAEEIKNEIESISHEFFNLDKEEKKRLQRFPKHIIERIISHSSLQLESEDSLIEFINELYTNYHEMCDLYSYVEFGNVSTEKMKEFIKLFEKDDLTRGVWVKICERLCEEIKNNNEVQLNKRYKNEVKSIVKEVKTKIFKEIFYNGREFDGLVNFLRKQTNIHDEISISYSSLAYGNTDTIFQFEDIDSSCWTNNLPNSWFCFEFKNHEIIPSNYTIRTEPYGTNGTHLKSWIFEGSADNNSWTKLDEVYDSSCLNGSHFSRTFGVRNENHKSFKYLRVRQTGPAWNNTNYFRFNCIEFFGQLI